MNAKGWSLPLHLPLDKGSNLLDEDGMRGSYGAADVKQPALLKGPRTGRVDCCQLLALIVVPFAIFAATYAALASSLHFFRPSLTTAILAAGACVVLCFVFSQLDQIVNEGRHLREPSFVLLLTVCAGLAYLCGVGAGSLHYAQYTEPYFSMTRLNIYTGVDPVLARGQQLMDAGMINFMPGARLQVNMSMGFQDGGLYCVVPITSGDERPVTYDFWAVGKDCCKASQPGFTCSSTWHLQPRGMTGDRLMDDKDKSFYQLAVKQAEAAYGITAAHPLFFIWRPPKESDNLGFYPAKASAATTNYLTGYFLLNLAIVILALLFWFRNRN